MSTRSIDPLIALAGAVVLSLGLLGPVVAEEDPSPSPVPAIDASTQRSADREAAREERKAAREERKADREAAREERKAEAVAKRQMRKAEREVGREERKAQRARKAAAWAGVKEACAAELKAVRTEDLERAERKEAWRAAKAACKELHVEARGSRSSAAEAEAIDEVYAEAASDGTGVVRTDLGIAEPGSTPGEELGLWHYLIPAQTELAPHTHPGWQLARVTDGELEYTVVEGEGVLLRADGSREPMGPGTYMLATGDGVIENPDLIHLGANRTDRPVTIISATLFETGEPISTLIEDGLEEEWASGLVES